MMNWRVGVWTVAGLTCATWYGVEAAWMARRRGSGSRPLASERRSTLVLLGMGVLGEAGAVALAWRRPTVPLVGDRTTAALVALPAVWAGLAVRWWAVRTLGTHFRATIDVRDDQPVIRTGPYRYVRHPSYTGGLLAVAGAATVLNDVPAWLVLTGSTLAALLYRIHTEDTILIHHLGPDYTDYAATTPRLIPRVW
ncbi:MULTISPECIES: isoprenylcysteine carboxylmethyltransferase family protein [Streptomyces]|uniref:Isoprenylcysteine carboxylmethyltransferase family protein n=1 Tax=Streptomyces yunnanensis TaxID=156453 RepID=A0ABY8AKA6_9ACTN|nr:MULTISPECIES: isoprenylcysteine carboxylmethyltransferase family protein [Streptomyces]WEB45427.1 isoprenylcysteine carboxylmethyltransferase family protein [Streptomyces yunnanensis]